MLIRENLDGSLTYISLLKSRGQNYESVDYRKSERRGTEEATQAPRSTAPSGPSAVSAGAEEG
jgi:hypothetical protein